MCDVRSSAQPLLCAHPDLCRVELKDVLSCNSFQRVEPAAVNVTDVGNGKAAGEKLCHEE